MNMFMLYISKPAILVLSKIQQMQERTLDDKICEWCGMYSGWK